MEIHPHGMPLFKAAGVSFDGRQERLQKLYNQNPWRKLLTQKTHYNGEPALAIWDAASGWQLGWVPKDLVQTYYKNNGEFDGEIVVGGDFCGLRVYSHEQPSQKLYRLVKLTETYFLEKDSLKTERKYALLDKVTGKELEQGLDAIAQYLADYQPDS